MKISQKNYRYIVPSLLFILMLGLAIYVNQQWHYVVNYVIESQKLFHESLALHVKSISQDPLKHGLSLIGLSFAYGVFHAIGPGHGKAVIITYLSSHQESLKRGAVMSLLAALLQSSIAILLIIVLTHVFSIRFSGINGYTQQITGVSYLLVMSLGAFLFFSALVKLYKRYRIAIEKKRDGSHCKTHNHHEHNCCGGHHVYQSSTNETFIKSAGVVFSMGMRPCSGAVVVLIYAHLVDAFLYGVLATLMMGLGTGLAISLIGLCTQLARNWFLMLVGNSEDKRHFNANFGLLFRMFGGVIIFLLGCSLYQAAGSLNGPHPIL